MQHDITFIPAKAPDAAQSNEKAVKMARLLCSHKALHHTAMMLSMGWSLVCSAHTSRVQRVDGRILQRDDSDAVGTDVNSSSWLSHDCNAQCVRLH